MTTLKVLISTDIEGVSGFVDWEQESTDRDSVRRHMTKDVVAAIDGVRQSYDDADIVVNDSHGSKDTIDIDKLHPDVQLIRGGPREFGMVSGVEHGLDVAFLIGYHTRGGLGGVLEHNFGVETVFEIRINKTPVGEVELNAFLLNEFEVPVGLVSGDDRLKKEVDSVLPHAHYVITKESLGMKAAKCKHPVHVRDQIREAAARATEVRFSDSNINFDFSPPITATVEYYQAETADIASLWPRISRVDSRTVEYEHEDFEPVYKFLRAACKL